MCSRRFHSVLLSFMIACIVQAIPTNAIDNSTVFGVGEASVTEQVVWLGENCTGRNDLWCKSTVSGGVVCDADTNTCECAAGQFRKDIVTCFQDTILTPVDVTFPDVRDNRLVAQWHMLDDSVSWQFNVTCTGTRSADVFSDTESRSSNITCYELIPGDTYNVTVIAYFTNDIGDILSGSASAMQALDPAIPGQLDIGLSNLTSPDVTLHWFASNGYVDKYLIQVEAHGDYESNETEVTVHGLLSGRMYQVKLTAVTNGRQGATRDDHFTTDILPPGPPRSVRAGTVTQFKMIVNWDPTIHPNGEIVGYIVCRREKVYADMVYDQRKCQKIGNETGYNASPVDPGAFYEFEVYSVNKHFNGTVPGKGYVRVPPWFPDEVEKLSAVVTNETVYLTWGRPSYPNGDIIQYKITWNSNHGRNCTGYLNSSADIPTNSLPIQAGCSDYNRGLIQENQKEMNYVIWDLQPYTNYTITVFSVSTYGSSYSGTKKFIHTSVTKPNPVQNLTAVVYNSTAIEILWRQPDNQPDQVTYIVSCDDMIQHARRESCRVKAQEHSRHEPVMDCRPEPPCVVTDIPKREEGNSKSGCAVIGLEEYWVYTFTVVAVNDAGSSDTRSTGNVTTKEGVPGPPRDITAMILDAPFCNSNVITVNWTEPALKNRNGAISKYILTWSISSSDNYSVNHPDPYERDSRMFSTEIIGLQPHSFYSLKIVAQTKLGHLGTPAVYNFTTIPCDVSTSQYNDLTSQAPLDSETTAPAVIHVPGHSSGVVIGAAIGGAIGGIVLTLFTILLIVFIYRRRKPLYERVLKSARTNEDTVTMRNIM